ncbi:50S ribosomal protein L1 [Candidatus Dojkabacteria bacterium]|nr:50S ribosomal protein L1 [Candidatus Dojkabacteria bacterium]
MRGKKYKKMAEGFENKLYPLDEAIKKAKDTSYSSFTGSIDLHIAMFLPKDKEAKSIKGSLSLPNTVKTEESRIVIFCEKDQEKEAKEAGAIEAGLDDLIKKIQDGWMEFDVVLAVPSVMGQIAVLGKELGPKGLMPNPKTGTLVENVKAGIEEFKKGKTKFICDDGGVVHLTVGKTDTEDEKIKANILYVIKSVTDTIGKTPESLLKSVTLSPTMGTGVKVDMTTCY